MTDLSNEAKMQADALATAAAAAMWERDHTAHALGMQIASVAAGRALLQMQVRQEMVNGHGICHGGMIFTLADTAFAYACNSGNQVTVASACQIDFIAPAREGDLLEAEAVERMASGRTGVYDVSVTAGGRMIALFRGKSHRIGGEVIPSEGGAAATGQQN